MNKRVVVQVRGWIVGIAGVELGTCDYTCLSLRTMTMPLSSSIVNRPILRPSIPTTPFCLDNKQMTLSSSSSIGQPANHPQELRQALEITQQHRQLADSLRDR